MAYCTCLSKHWSHTPVAVFPNAFLVGLNGLWLLALLVQLGDLASAPDGSLAKATGTPLEALQEVAQEAAKAFVQLLVPFARRGLIEGVYTVCSSCCHDAT